MEHLVIIGNGIAGITAARHIRKLSDKKITILSAETEYFFSRTALMYVYMGHMRWQDIEPYESWFWEKNRLELKKAYVERVDTDNKTLFFKEGGYISYDKLIIASGSVTNTFGWEGLDLNGVQGLVNKQDLETLEKNAPNNKACPHAVIIGGGLIGVELAEMLRTRDIKVTMLVREEGFWANVLPLPEAEMISQHVISHGVNLKHLSNLDKIIGDADGNVKAVITNCTKPLVIDADALNCICNGPEILKSLKAPAIITPHPGEMARLINSTPREINSDRENTAINFAKRYGVITVLKGAGTIIASPDGKAYINHTGNSGMATGGSGDVLAGIIGSMLAQGANPFRAAAAGVFLHGTAGDIAAEKLGRISMLPTDMTELLPDAFQRLM